MATNIYLKDVNNVIWSVGIDDTGALTTVLAPGKTPSIPILKDYQGGLTAWQLGISIAGALTTTNTNLAPSLTPGIPLLSNPSNVLWSLVVSAAGAYTTIKTASKTAGYITTLAMSLLNDASGLLWNFNLLLPFLQLAFNDLSQALENNQVPITREFSIVVGLPVNTQVIGFGTMPSLPSNFIVPIYLEEKWTNQDDSFWIPMKQVENPVDDIQTNYLVNWWWDGIQLNFLGSTSQEDVKLKYTGGLYVPQASTDAINPTGAENYLANRTAYYAADSIGNSYTANSCDKRASIFLEQFIRFLAKSDQGLPVRRRAYRGRRNRTYR